MPITRAYTKAGSPLQGLANPVINGGFDIWQRGTSIARSGSGGTAADYTADRWVFGGSGGSAVTVSRQTTSDTTNLPNIQYCGRFQRNSGNTDTSTLYYGYVFENVNSTPFIGKTITVSFYARKGANFSSANDNLNFSCGTGTGTDQAFFSFTGANTPIGQNNTLTTTWQRFAATGTLSSTGTQLRLWFSYGPQGTAGANDYFEVTGVQIDIGTYTAATAPEFRRSGGTLAGELAAAQRYFWRYAPSISTNTTFASGLAISTTRAIIPVRYPVVMRTTPSLTWSGTTGHFRVMFGAYGTADATSVAFNSGGVQAFELDLYVASGLTTGNAVLAGTGSSSAYVDLSAEL